MIVSSEPVVAAGHEIFVRAAVPDDQAFVASTWREGLIRADRSSSVRYVNELIDGLLDQPGVRVACAVAGIANKIVGWLAWYSAPRQRVLIYCYVRSAYRREGIARALARFAWGSSDAPLVYVMRGPDAARLLAAHPSTHLPVSELLGG